MYTQNHHTGTYYITALKRVAKEAKCVVKPDTINYRTVAYRGKSRLVVFFFQREYVISNEQQNVCRKRESIKLYKIYKTIFETRRHNFMCQLYDWSNSLVRVCYVVTLRCISGAFLSVLSVCLCLICCTLVVLCTVVAAVVCE